jgi:hypothetical protein
MRLEQPAGEPFYPVIHRTAGEPGVRKMLSHQLSEK